MVKLKETAIFIDFFGKEAGEERGSLISRISRSITEGSKFIMIWERTETKIQADSLMKKGNHDSPKGAA